MIPFNNRFHGHSSLNYVYRNGQVFRSRFATLKFSPNTKRDKSRIAVVVGKKVIKSAVSRNRIRRRIYEHIRLKMPKFDKSYDLIIIVTSSELMTMPASDHAVQIDQLLDQAKLYKTV
jgi:ribonuclease P protein component